MTGQQCATCGWSPIWRDPNWIEGFRIAPPDLAQRIAAKERMDCHAELAKSLRAADRQPTIEVLIEQAELGDQPWWPVHYKIWPHFNEEMERAVTRGDQSVVVMNEHRVFRKISVAGRSVNEIVSDAKSHMSKGWPA